jgi:hypothetical protein
MTPHLQAAYDILKASHAALLELGKVHQTDPVTHKAILKIARASLDVMRLIYTEDQLIEIGEEAMAELTRVLAKQEAPDAVS